MLQETLLTPLLKQLWYHNLKKQNTSSIPCFKQDCSTIIKRSIARCIIQRSPDMKLHAVSLGALYKQRCQGQQVHVTGVSKGQGSIWKLGWGEGKNGCRDKYDNWGERGRQCILLYLPVHIGLSALIVPLWRTNGAGRWKPHLDLFNVSFPYY